MSRPAEDTAGNLKLSTSKTPVINQMEKRINLKTKDIKIGKWNVRTMQKTGKFENIKEEMKKTSINIIGLGEVRWIGESDMTDTV